MAAHLLRDRETQAKLFSSNERVAASTVVGGGVGGKGFFGDESLDKPKGIIGTLVLRKIGSFS